MVELEGTPGATGPTGPAEPEGVAPSYVRARLDAGEPLLLVCAYEKDVGFRKYHVPDAISWTEAWDRLAGLPRDHEIVFY